jgi:hypothetical protein
MKTAKGSSSVVTHSRGTTKRRDDRLTSRKKLLTNSSEWFWIGTRTSAISSFPSA